MSLSPKQVGLLERLRHGALLILHVPPGAEDRWAFYIEKPYSDEDGRTCWSVINRGLLKDEKGMWTIGPKGLEELEKATA